MFFISALTWILLLPVIGALAAMVTPARFARWLALIFAAATFVLSMVLFFRIALNGFNFGNLNNPAYSIDLPWINFTTSSFTFRINYFLGVDGLSLPMVILNALLTVLAIIGGWEKTRVKEYMALLLLLETGVMGVFMSLDLLLFFLFWEVELAPMFLLIGIWGSDVIKHGMPGRIYSAWKFLLYTFFGSVFMLAGILILYFKSGGSTASMQYFSMHFLTGTVTIPLIGVTMSLQLLIFLLIYLAFAIKIPMFPFHTWLPDAHTDAPTEVSVILAGILLKMGAYGLIRVCLTLLPGGIHEFAGWLAVLAAINIIYGAAICLVQSDMKKLIAYSSVSHMGIVLLGVAAAAGTLTTSNVAKTMPLLATLFTFAGLASLGLPGLAGFVAEYMTFTSSYQVWSAVTIVSVFTMILTAAYLLWMLKRVFYGPFNTKWNRLPDANWREALPMITLAVVIVFVGVFPNFLINVITPALAALLHGVSSVGIIH